MSFSEIGVRIGFHVVPTLAAMVQQRHRLSILTSWSGMRDSNPRSSGPKPDAVPGSANSRKYIGGREGQNLSGTLSGGHLLCRISDPKLVDLARVELATSRLQGGRSPV